MMAGAVAKATDSATEHLSAYVVLSEGLESRLFKVSGTTSAPKVEELNTVTTLDIQRFHRTLKEDLAEFGPMQPADPNMVCDIVRVHLRCDLGV
jgi:hypothetical protein